MAKSRFGDKAQEYIIEATVFDASRRHIRGQTQVKMQPHKKTVRVWADGGFIKNGQNWTLFAASEGDASQAQGRALEVRVSQLSKDGSAGTLVQKQGLVINDNGEAQVTMRGLPPGRYRADVRYVGGKRSCRRFYFSGHCL